MFTKPPLISSELFLLFGPLIFFFLEKEMGPSIFWTQTIKLTGVNHCESKLTLEPECVGPNLF